MLLNCHMWQLSISGYMSLKKTNLDKDDPVKNAVQIQSSFKEFEKNIKWLWDTYLLPYKRIRITLLLTSDLQESTNTEFCISNIHKHIHANTEKCWNILDEQIT